MPVGTHVFVDETENRGYLVAAAVILPPHVTVARGLHAQALREQAWPMDLPEPLAFSADGFVLMSSGGAGEGPRYQVIHEWKSHRRHRGEP